MYAIGLAPHLFGIKPITFSSLNFPWMKCIALENMYAIGLAPHLFGIKPITFSSLNFPWMKCIALENMYVLLHHKKLYNTRCPDLSAIVMIIEKRPNLLSEKLTSNNVNWSVRRTAVNNLRWCSRFVWGIRINGIVRAETSLLVFFRKPECDVDARYCFTCT